MAEEATTSRKPSISDHPNKPDPETKTISVPTKVETAVFETDDRVRLTQEWRKGHPSLPSGTQGIIRFVVNPKTAKVVNPTTAQAIVREAACITFGDDIDDPNGLRRTIPTCFLAHVCTTKAGCKSETHVSGCLKARRRLTGDELIRRHRLT